MEKGIGKERGTAPGGSPKGFPPGGKLSPQATDEGRASPPHKPPFFPQTAAILRLLQSGHFCCR